MQLSLPATFKSFSSSFLEIGQKHIPYTIGPGKKLHIFKNAWIFYLLYIQTNYIILSHNKVIFKIAIPRTGPLPASSMPRQQSSVRHMSGIWEPRRQLTELSDSNWLRSMRVGYKGNIYKYSRNELKKPDTQKVMANCINDWMSCDIYSMAIRVQMLANVLKRLGN